jgi:hypothetical protein
MKAHQGGHVADSDEFHSAVKEHWQALRAPPARTSPAVESSPEFLEHLDLPEPRRSTSFMSAPVSRETASTGYSHDDGPGRVRMTPAMKEAARISGLTDLEYAANVLRLREEKAQGNYGGQA